MLSSRANSHSNGRRKIWKVDGRYAASMTKAVIRNLRLSEKFLNKIENLHCDIASSMSSFESRKAA